MPSTRTAAHGDIQPEHLVARATAERKSVRGLRLGALPTLLLWLTQVNVILAVFNLVPGFPLDGGRVLRAFLWGLTDNLRLATRWASFSGQVVAWALIGVGFAMIVGARVPVFGSGLLGGLWLAFIGWFLNNAAVMGYQQLLLQEALHGLPIARLMQTGFDVVSPDMVVQAFVEDHLFRSPQRVFPVVENGQLVGVVGLKNSMTSTLRSRIGSLSMTTRFRGFICSQVGKGYGRPQHVEAQFGALRPGSARAGRAVVASN